MKMKSFTAVQALFIIVLFLTKCSSDSSLPVSLQGTWSEDSVKNDFPDEKPKFEKSNSSTILRFEQQNKKAVLYVSNFYDPFKKEHQWSEPYRVKKTGKDSWSFMYGSRKVSLKLQGNNQLYVKGLSVRMYNPELIKKDSEPVEAIFIKKEYPN